MTQETHDQLPLKLIDQFSYSPERFVVHSGIKEIVDSFEQISIAHKYSINFIFGQECVGKTHLSIYMAKHGQIKVIANLISGKEFGELIEAVNNKSLSVPEVLVVDDVDAYLNKIQPDHSGAFVTFIELCRRANSRIFLLSSTSIEDLPCDDHIKSRLRSGSGSVVQEPDFNEVNSLIECMAKQRGIALSAAKVGFLSRRVGRSIKAIEECLERLSMMGKMADKISSFDVLNVVV